jgi:hypothetical protein
MASPIWRFLGVSILLALGVPAFAEAPPELPAPVIELADETPPTPPTDEAKKDDAKKADKEDDGFRSRYRHSLLFIGGDGRKAFDVIEWASRPDLYTLGDLAAWPTEKEYDFNGGLGFNMRWWSGPDGDAQTRVPNLPPQVYDLYFQATWRQRWADGIASEVTILPGLYTDFRTTPPDSFRIPGHAVASFRLAPDLHLVAGAQHLQRDRVKVLPIVGFLWEPDARWQWRLVFPEPKVSFRLAEKEDLWVYTRGEYGGGRWAYKDDAGHADQVEYSDVRVAVGFEWGNMAKSVCTKVPPSLGFVELGYVFDRRLEFTNGTPTQAIPRGWMVGLGCIW